MKYLLILSFLTTYTVLAAEYFESGIDYWNSSNTKTDKTKGKQKVIPKKDNKDEIPDKFSWKKQLDPKNEEFFKEGDYTPPAAFMELVRNPSDKNIKNWFKLIDLKNKLSTRLSQRMEEYLAKKSTNLQSQGIQYAKVIKQNLKTNNSNAKSYVFRMYFDSKCPHCKKMMKTLSEIQSMGYFVELKQLDNNRRYSEGLPFPVTQASENELNQKDINSVPVLFIGDLKNKLVYRLNGYKSTQQIFQAIENRNLATKVK